MIAFACVGRTCDADAYRVSLVGWHDAERPGIRYSHALAQRGQAADPVQDEVRALGRLPALNVPEAFIARHPFPGARPRAAQPALG